MQSASLIHSIIPEASNQRLTSTAIKRHMAEARSNFPSHCVSIRPADSIMKSYWLGRHEIRLDQIKSYLIRSELIQDGFLIISWQGSCSHAEILGSPEISWLVRKHKYFCMLPTVCDFVIVKDLRGKWGVKPNRNPVHDRCTVLPTLLEVLNDNVTWTIFSWEGEMH